MRGSFSIATVVNPEILIVDEILSVGDENFQKKSHARMMELMAGGTTVLYVSHNLDQIREMCNRVVWLENHTVKMFGDVKAVSYPHLIYGRRKELRAGGREHDLQGSKKRYCNRIL